MYYIIAAVIALVAAWILIRCLYVPYPSPHTLYFGKPGSGKTMYLTRIAFKYKSKHTIFSNYPVATPGVYKFKKNDLGSIAFPEGSILLFDEASLNGFDNREFNNNFKGNNALEFFKKIRHHKCVMVWSNQGYNELDAKVRTLTQDIYIVKKLPVFSVAIRIYFDTGPNKETKTIDDQYKYASIFRLLFDPRCVQLVYRPKYGKFYNSWDKEVYKTVPLVPWYRPSKPPGQTDPGEANKVENKLLKS